MQSSPYHLKGVLNSEEKTRDKCV